MEEENNCSRLKLRYGWEALRSMIRMEVNRELYKIEHLTTNLMEKRTGRITNRHRHPVFHLMYITKGRGQFLINDRITEASEGMLYTISPNEWHCFDGNESEPMSNLECTFLLQDANGNPAVVDFFELVEHHRGIRLSPAVRYGPVMVPSALRPMVIEGFHTILEARQACMAKAHIEVFVMDLLLRVAEAAVKAAGLEKERIDTSTDSAVASVKQYLRAHFGRSVTLNELASFVHLTPNHLCKIFKTQTGKTPMGYLYEIRMLEAAKLLVHTDLPIYMIAEKLGFEEASYFARVFRKQFGTSPKEYRNRQLL